MRTSRTTRAAAAIIATAAATLGLTSAASAAAVTISTGSPQDVTSSGATFRAHALLNALGGGVYWQYGPTTGYGATTSTVGMSLLGVAQDVTLPVTGLTANTTYHVRAVATSLLSLTYGHDEKFTTKKAGSGTPSDSGSGTSSSGSGSSGSGSSGSGSSGTGTPSTTAPATTSTPTTSKSGDDASSSGSSGDDGGATTAPGVATADVTPVLGRKLAIATVAGKVTATAPSGTAVDLGAAKAVPTGTLIDTRRGTVELTTALDRKGATQTGRFWGGLFEVRQGTATHGLTRLVLRGANFSRCPATTARARAATVITKKKKPARSLWGSDDHGRFETRGRGSVATVRGTRWRTQDTCAGTRTTVAAGAVAVRDLARGKTVVVTKGHNYFARLAP